MSKANDRELLPTEFLATRDMIRACADRDLGAIFRLAREDAGFTLSKLARLCEMTPSRVGDYVKGRAHVRQQHVVERVSHGLRIPGEMLGLAPQPWEEDGYRPVVLDTAFRPAGAEGRPKEASRDEQSKAPDPIGGHRLGDVVELSLTVDLVVRPGGEVHLTYRQTVLNLTHRPLTRMVRELWFEHTKGDLTITPTDACDRQIAIQRLYDTPGLAKFACQISPPVPPGETTVIEYVCEGGMFVESTYWRQSIVRYTQEFALNVTHLGIAEFRGCTAVEEYPDGSETSGTQDTRWSMDGDALTVRLAREDLHANQYVTLHWDVIRDTA